MMKKVWIVYDEGDDSASIMPTLLAYDDPSEAVAPAICYDTVAKEYYSDDVVQGLIDALRWYGDKSRLCRLIHTEGDEGRYALSEDGGRRANDALRSFTEEAK